MNKIAFFLLFIISGCASRGYKGLAEEVPEIFPEFKVENYEKKETPRNIVYTEKILPDSEKEKKEFYEEEYIKKKKPESYGYYVPKDRVLELESKNPLLKELLKVNTTFGNRQSYVIEEDKQ